MIHMWLHRMDYFVVVISLTHTPADAQTNTLTLNPISLTFNIFFFPPSNRFSFWVQQPDVGRGFLHRHRCCWGSLNYPSCTHLQTSSWAKAFLSLSLSSEPREFFHTKFHHFHSFSRQLSGEKLVKQSKFKRQPPL